MEPEPPPTSPSPVGGPTLPNQLPEMGPHLPPSLASDDTDVTMNGGSSDEDTERETESAADKFIRDLVSELPPMDMDDDEILDEQRFQWEMTTFADCRRQIDKSKLYSPEFVLGGRPFRIMVFPWGNRGEDNVSVFLDCGAAPLPPGFECFVHFQLYIVNKHRNLLLHKVSKHRFTAKAINWGFPELLPRAVPSYDEFLDPQTGGMIFGVRASVVEGQSLEWGMYSRYDSKKATGMVGLNNQGATCYMNSLLQTLYYTQFLRGAVFHMPTEKEDQEKSVALALQRVFFKLQTAPEAVDTNELTKSFGWDSIDSFMQHDVQEFLRVLLDNLEEKMKKTEVEGVVGKLFEGKMKSYIKCKNVDYESSRTESYYDIQLNVKGNKTLAAAFKDYIQVEVMDGENQYRAEGHGMQDADKGIIFQTFPPVLHLQLKRFEYSFERDENYKINDRFEFPEVVDLTEYLEDPAAEETPPVYVLHSVLVHSGTLHGGHYIAYIRPTLEKWYRFDDEHVSKAKAEHAMDQNFGVDPDEAYRRRVFTNAYMLVYVRKSSAEEVLRPLTAKDVPEYLVERFQQEDEERQRKLEEERSAHLYANLVFMTEENFRKDNLRQLDLLPKRRQQLGHVMKIHKKMTVAHLMTMIEKDMSIPVARQRLWPMISRQNSTFRPEDAVEDYGQEVGTALSPNATVFLEELPEGEPSVPLSYNRNEKDILVFIKTFDPEAPDVTVQYAGHLVANSQWTVAQTIDHARPLLSLPEGTALVASEEIKSTMVQGLRADTTLYDAEIQTGDILVVHRAPTETSVYPTADSIFKKITSAIKMTFQDLKGKVESFVLEMDRRMNYWEVADAVAEKIGLQDRTLLQFTYHEWMNEVPGHPIVVGTHAEEISLDFMRRDRSSHRPQPKLYFDVLPIPVQEAEDCYHFPAAFLYTLDQFKIVPADVYVPRHGLVQDLVDAVCDAVDYQGNRDNLRVVEILDHDVRSFLAPNRRLQASMDGDYFRVEEIPADQRELMTPDHPHTDRRLIRVQHIWKDRHRAHDHPFVFTFVDGETASDLRLRLQSFLRLEDAEFAKWKLGIVSYATGPMVKYLADNDVVETADLDIASEYFVLDHLDKTPRKPSRWGYEKAIKIHN